MSRSVIVKCDGYCCGGEVELDVWEYDINGTLDAKGWLIDFDNESDYCPRCVKKMTEGDEI